jgi:MFS family permease
MQATVRGEFTAGMGAAVRARLVDAASACSVNLRSRNLRAVQSAFGLMWAGEWAATVALGVVAFGDGGALAVGLVGLARMLPAAIVAPFAATIADRVRRERVLVAVAAARALTLGVAAAVSFSDGPVVLVYAALVVATVAQTLFRPAHSALLPTLCLTPGELTSANVVRGLLDSAATLTGPLVAALLLGVSGPGAVFAASAAASALAGACVLSLTYEAPPSLGTPSTLRLREGGEGIRTIAGDPQLSLLTGLTALQTFTRGALTVFLVVVAIRLVGSGAAAVGLLTAALGAGAVAGSLLSALLVGAGRLARWFGLGVLLWGAPLALIAALPRMGAAIAMLAIVGVGNAFVDVGVFTLLARLAGNAVLARVYAAFEAVLVVGVAAGTLTAPLLIGAVGTRGALVAVGGLAPLAVLVSWSRLRAIDARVRVQDSDVALLQRIGMLRALPVATIEQLAAGLTRSEVSAGTVVFAQGDEGRDFFVIEGGRAAVVRDGAPVATLGPGEGFGEIALLRDVRRTASVRALTPLRLCALSRRVFVAAVTGYSRSAAAAEALVGERIGADAPFHGRAAEQVAEGLAPSVTPSPHTSP